jgi:hypothetical protein
VNFSISFYSTVTIEQARIEGKKHQLSDLAFRLQLDSFIKSLKKRTVLKSPSVDARLLIEFYPVNSLSKELIVFSAFGHFQYKDRVYNRDTLFMKVIESHLDYVRFGKVVNE